MTNDTVNEPTVAVIGAHGKVARLAIPQLAEHGCTVAGVIRNPQHAADIEKAGAQPVIFDVEHNDADSMAQLLRQWGVGTLVWAAGAGGGDPHRTWAVDRDAAIRAIDAAREAGVGHFVMVSYFGAGEDHGVPEDHCFYPYAQAKTEADAHLASSGVSFTLLRPSRLTDAPATGLIDADSAEAAEVSRANVAHAIAAAVAHPPAGSPGTRTVQFNDGSTPVKDVFGA
ncbi:NAD(P)H-binding protein [Corynebacterium lipophiloflavum]|uniref:NAD dependent epimerase/dehydratase family protein n=1 Tax=Corynebacterium lipophiloflavum (strain ATCC 700352 / DSM 44291 / CCUG 37336 / JCM 10383 / DMMZ 1944) TaxID=525263 RepID=C0XPD9_CORLD|nr:NAD(P)H-binding protein [Corynebacterium lipophiloflavum]EEI17873.1 NAD dependent epimerase/dehydratase family protein [Corynebacterium lipophiloflavum DSM 44291]